MNKKMIKELKTLLRKKFERWKFEKIELVIADWYWNQMKDTFFMSHYPPSFYYYNSPEVVSKRLKEDIKKDEEEIEQIRVRIAEIKKGVMSGEDRTS